MGSEPRLRRHVSFRKILSAPRSREHEKDTRIDSRPAKSDRLEGIFSMPRELAPRIALHSVGHPYCFVTLESNPATARKHRNCK